MTIYEALYHKAFNAITDAERLIEQAAILLRAAQLECEEGYIDGEDAPPQGDAD